MLVDSLKKLSQGNQPQTLDELFRGSKEGMMTDRVVAQINALLPQMRDRILEEVKRMVLDMVQVQGLTGLIREAANNVKEELKGEVELIVPPLFDEFASKIRMPKDGEKGEPGKAPTREEVISIVKPFIPKQKEKEKEKELEIEKVKGLKSLLDNLSDRISSIRTKKGGGGGSTMKVNDLSSQVNGVAVSFTLTHKSGPAHLLFYTGFPSVLIPSTDYTITANVLTISTFTPASGQALAVIYEEA